MNFFINYMFEYPKKLFLSNKQEKILYLSLNSYIFELLQILYLDKKQNYNYFYKKDNYIYDNIKHYFHLVTPSPWPFLSSLIVFILMGGSVLYFHFFLKGGFLVFIGFFLVLFIMFVWWRDVKREATFEGFHTKQVQLGLRYGMLLFIISEIMFFFSFFWAFFHSSLAPTIDIGSFWPPSAINCFNYTKVPLLNTIILLYSGAAVTWAHYALVSHDSNLNYYLNNLVLNTTNLNKKFLFNLFFMFLREQEQSYYHEFKKTFMFFVYGSDLRKKYFEYNFYIWYEGIGNKKETLIALFLTIILAVFFTFCQAIEYFEATFSFIDGIYGSCFYIATGFHGLHVIIGTIFLSVCFFRIIKDHLSVNHHFGFEAAAWYWHFVDVVWLFLFVSIYIWGSIH